MSIEKLERDLAYISKLSDYPGSQDGLTTDEFKAMFDAAPLAIQDYINNVLVPAIVAIAPGEDDGTYLLLAGGKMRGTLDMGGQRLKNLPAPVEDDDATPKSYVLPKTGGSMFGDVAMSGYKVKGLGIPTESGDAASKGYVDGRHLSGELVLSSAGWVGGIQEVAVAGILAADRPHWGIVYGQDPAADKEAFALVDELEAQARKFIFRCFEDVPETDLTIEWEVNR
jgi:hypothetical protein